MMVASIYAGRQSSNIVYSFFFFFANTDENIVVERDFWVHIRSNAGYSRDMYTRNVYRYEICSVLAIWPSDTYT